jgi:hypothetical protein
MKQNGQMDGSTKPLGLKVLYYYCSFIHFFKEYNGGVKEET